MKTFDVIIGGSGDIGLAIVMNFLERGRNVLYTYNANSDVVDLVNNANVFECEAIALKLDTTSHDDILNLSVYIKSNQINVNNLIYNVGKTKDLLFKSMTEQDFMDVLNTNLIGCFRICKALIDNIAINSGSIIIMSSISGVSARIGQVNYSCSKAALIALGRNLAAEYAKLGLRVNSIVY